LVVVVGGTLALLPAGASAEPVCTDTWTGSSEGTWQTATNWSTGKVPSSTDVACIEAGNTVKVSEGADKTGVLLDKGTLLISVGSFEVANALEASSVHALTLEGENTELTGPGTLNVSGSLTWESGTMSGTGATVVLSGGSASLGPATHKQLVERSFVNEGTTTFAQGQLRMSQGAVIKNTGTFIANSAGEFPQVEFQPEVGATPKIVNTGTFEKTEKATTTIKVPFENHGSVQANGGTLEIAGGGSSNSEAEWKGVESFAVEFAEKA
jgi:hypothetical protein